ncbi:hypothetical protein [Halosegnis longus]|uniref:Uncharacterized protein n=1 Tax=Halosegnis longus TaxID=2216012 RepID=A0AAJ4UVL6_9EURY|nr:hypothetical protein Nmn1133_05190 [Salella cibi]
MLTPTRQYGAAIALASGLYSLFAMDGAMASTAGTVMAVVGAVAVVHGIVLLTPVADRLGNASGPLMVGYSLVMLVNQAVAMDSGGSSTDMGMGMDSSQMGEMMALDAGMVALAALMLVSGLIMTRTDETGM